ncbi:hypothetical protein H0H93_006436 [Arthromyces matolae]|nr:hypothetical protein H0H93_006436 [Arthromyces matolae]
MLPDNIQDPLYTIELIDVHEEDGCLSIALALPGLINQWKGQIREISLDSTFNTNASNYEVYALIGEVYGSGCPLGYLFLHATNGDSGAKERFITDFLNYFRRNCNLEPIITLTDKDFSEINAFRKVFPDAKHQLCFWHCLRAIKTRLSVLRRRPKYYDVLEAKKEFDWIDESFVPISQSKEQNPDTRIAAKALPVLTIRLNGELQNRAPDPTPKSQRLVIRLNGKIRSLVSVPSSIRPSRHNESSVPEQQGEDGNETDDEDDDENDLRREVDDFYDQTDESEIDMEDGPDWMFDEAEKTSPDPNYVFCPAPHRKQLLHLYTKHFCQHPAFVDRDGQWDKERIYREACYAMYTFCYKRGLREVWGYMWTNWYSPKMWSLWARSTSPYISRLRTTMNVENFWRQLKHDYLHKISRPRLDHLVWILIYKVTAAYVARAEVLNNGYRLGRTKALTSFQRYFKTDWEKLKSAAISGRLYTTDLKNFTCNCGRQKYNRHHLCKHLVQAFDPPPPLFFSQISRRRVPPLYQHPDLKPKDATESPFEFPDADGSVTDGDDHFWTGDREMLRGGQWRKLIGAGRSKQPQKRRRESTESLSDSRMKKPRTETQALDSDIKIIDLTADNEIVDLTGSSPAPALPDDFYGSSTMPSSPSRSSSPIHYGSDDENQTDEYVRELEKMANMFEEAAHILRGQIPFRNPIWLRSICNRKVGRDVMHLVNDVRLFEETGRTRDTTWAEGRSKSEKRRRDNTMGYTRREEEKFKEQ